VVLFLWVLNVCVAQGVSPQQFQSLVRQINTYLEESEDVTCTTFWESFLAFFTFYSSLLCTTPSSLKVRMVTRVEVGVCVLTPDADNCCNEKLHSN
jgi:hypothetical protein